MEKGRFAETPCSEVECEVDEGVELALAEGDGHQALDGLLGFMDIPKENDFGLRFADAIGVALGMDKAVAVTDGGDAGDVEVGAGAKAL